LLEALGLFAPKGIITSSLAMGSVVPWN